MSNFNDSFISLDASDRITIQTSLGKIRDLLAQLQRKTKKPDCGMGRDAAQLYDGGSLENDYTQDYLLQVSPFSLGIGYSSSAYPCFSPHLRGNVALPKAPELDIV